MLREIADAGVGLRDAAKLAGEHAELARERDTHDELLGVVQQLVEVEVLVDEAAVDAGHACLGAAVDEHADEQVHEFIAGGAMHRPTLRKALEMSEYFLEDEIRQLATARVARRGRQRLQALEILLGIVHAVRVLDAQTANYAGR